MPNETIRCLKKKVLLGAILFTITFMEICWSMGNFSERISLGFLDCSFVENVYLMSILTAIFLTIVFLVFSFIKKIYLKSVIEMIVLIPIWVLLNYAIFVDRKSSWSIDIFQREFFYTILLSIVPVLVVSIAVVLFARCISIVRKVQ
ncbi:hypothetical protein [Flavobacterium sp. KACC 22763]|uniref:hypothetical protein n=1 Tax=Flavobacterium sp. KACC 22763 TaxID=3025668 RepID=UPI002365BAAE|nr:hypothetical protein [Flavobacterium sp. KACC 22763]WDF65461.1 hypothetical protein PQ463_04695 [Flavobacterium sp. KACC 22763]